MVKKKNSKIIIEGTDGDIRKQAEENPYKSSLEPKKLPKTAFYHPNVSSKGNITKNAFLAKQAQQASTTGTTDSGNQTGIQSFADAPLYYDYRFSTPDKYYFPKNRVLANSIWREMYKRDPAIAIATDMYSDLPWSDFSIAGIDDPEIKKFYEDMFNEINIVGKLPEFSRDYLVVGELVLHAIFNSTKGYWERIISHNPDYIRVEGVGLAIEDPLLWLKPTPEIKRLINSSDPRVRKLKNVLPRKIINAVRSNQEIPLDALNTTFLPRLNSSYDLRGQSLYTRLFRIVMYEDFIVNASLSVAQRNAAPLRIFKLIDPATGWVGDTDDQAAFAEMLSIAEQDPLAAIITPLHVQTELVGVSDRMLLISREWEFIERVKLLALGVAKSFLIGETSFAAAAAGLQTLLERLASLRLKFEKDWIIKKLCKPLAEMHGFYKRPQNELDHRIRVQRPEERELLIPAIKWSKSLESVQEGSLLNFWSQLRDKGLVSDRTVTTGAGLDLDIERKNIEEERKYQKEHPKTAPMVGAPTPSGLKAPGPIPTGLPPTPELPSEEAPGLPEKAPSPTPIPLPGGSAKFTKYSNDIEAALEELSDNEDKVTIPEALEVIKESQDKELLDKKREDLYKKLLDVPQSNKSLLSGS
jgi:hypothetical protein